MSTPSRKYVVVLAITTDEPGDDPRLWPYDDLLAAPEGESERFVGYVAGWQVTA